MGRGGSLYISTDPNNNVPIGVPGVGVSIGPMGTNIYDAGAFQTVTDGATVQIAPNASSQEAVYNLQGAGTFAALTLNFAPGFADRQAVYITFAMNVTTLTFSGATFGGLALPAAATAGQQIVFLWSQGGTVWNRIV